MGITFDLELTFNAIYCNSRLFARHFMCISLTWFSEFCIPLTFQLMGKRQIHKRFLLITDVHCEEYNSESVFKSTDVNN